MIALHPLQRIVDGPDEVARPIHWTVPLSVGRYRVSPRPAAETAVALDYTINLPTHGVYLRGTGPRAAVVDASQAVLFARGTETATQNPVATGHGGMYLRLSPEVACALAAELPDPHPARCWSRQFRLGPVLRRRWLSLWQAAHQGLDDDALYEQGLAVAGAILQGMSGTPAGASLSHEARERVQAVRLHLAAHPGSPETLDALAAQVGWSRFQLCRAFSRVTGESVHRHRETLRMAHALECLRDPALDLGTLALHLGYTHHSHFSARFRAWMGCTPSAWRQQVGQG